MPPETRDIARVRRTRPFGGGASLAFMLLVLMGVSGAAVFDPALGVWNVVAAGRTDSDRTARSATLEARIVAARDAHAERRLAAALPASARVTPLATDETSDQRADAPRQRARSGRGALPPPALV